VIDATADLMWLHGYRMRASGLPRPPDPAATSEAIEVPTETVEGWDDLDALLQLVEKALKVPPG
jgi:hypothetical protein